MADISASKEVLVVSRVREENFQDSATFIIPQRPPRTSADEKQASESVWASLMNKPRGPKDLREAPRMEGRE